MRKPISAEQVRDDMREVCKLSLKGIILRDPKNMSDDELSELSEACEIAQCNIDSYIVDRRPAEADEF